MSIHPRAVVSPTAKIGPNVEIGPLAIVEDDVTLSAGCILEGSAIVKRGATLGPNNHLYEGAVIGGRPQHLRASDRMGQVVIGAGNTFREFVTVHRAMHEDAVTTIGDNNFFMAGSHVAHDCRVGNNTIFANYALLAGHVTVDDRAYVSAGVGVHQFCRIGTLAMVGGHAAVVKDVPPFVTIDGQTGLVVGLNQVGLRRAGYNAEQVAELKAAYRLIYRSGLSWTEVLRRLQLEFPNGLSGQYYQFLSASKRGVTPERRPPPAATIKLRRVGEDEADAEPHFRAKAS